MGEFPSKEHQFTSENQPENNGRPKGSLSLKTLIRKVWGEEYTEENGNKTVRAIKTLKALIEKAEKGDVSAFRALAERLEGQPKQEIDQNIKGKAVIEVVRPSYDKDKNNT
jgi:hypothetical protein